MAVRDDAFWQAHERRRREQGLSVRQYCQDNELALSTYRHRTSGRRRGRAAAAVPAAAPAALVASAPPRFIAVPPEAPAAADAPAAVVEVVRGDGMMLRIAGAAAEHIVERVLARERPVLPSCLEAASS